MARTWIVVRQWAVCTTIRRAVHWLLVGSESNNDVVGDKRSWPSAVGIGSKTRAMMMLSSCSVVGWVVSQGKKWKTNKKEIIRIKWIFTLSPDVNWIFSAEKVRRQRKWVNKLDFKWQVGRFQNNCMETERVLGQVVVVVDWAKFKGRELLLLLARSGRILVEERKLYLAYRRVSPHHFSQK